MDPRVEEGDAQPTVNVAAPVTDGEVTALSRSSYTELDHAHVPTAPAFDREEVWRLHGADLLRYYAFPMLQDVDAARAVVFEAFDRLAEDWALWWRDGLSIEDCLWHRTVLLIRAHPMAASPPSRREGGDDLLARIGSLDLGDREVVVLHDVDPARRSGERILGRPAAELEVARSRVHDHLRAQQRERR